MENGTPCHFTRAGEKEIFVGHIVEQPNKDAPKQWGGIRPPPRYGVEYMSNGIIVRCYIPCEQIIPHECVRK